MNRLVGQTLNRYRIISLLGEGGMGAVFKGHDVTLQRDVAIKVMHPHFASQPNFQERFLQEARTAARLDHPNIVQVHDFGQDRSNLYIVMKFIPGDNLEKMLQDMHAQGKWILLSEAGGLIEQVSSALHYAHRQGVLHRDIKPGNIMIEPEPSDGLPYRPIVTDLGLAKLAEGGIVTQDGTSMGTPSYMSPEQALGQTTDARSDVYSLGVLLFELATGRLPFPARNLVEAIQYHVNTPPPKPASIRADIPPELEKIILRCMEKDPKNRFQSAGDLAAALKETSHSTHTIQTAPSPLQGAVSLFTEYQQSLLAQRGVSILEEFQVPSELHQDRIQVLGQDATTRSEIARRPTTMIGRDADNHIVIDDRKASRHHARVEYHDGEYQVVDLNSTNGTYLANQRLLPGVAERWLSEKALRIGDTWFRLLLTHAARAGGSGTTLRRDDFETDGVQATAGPGLERIRVSLASGHVSVEPGNSATVTLSIQNQGSSVDQFSIFVGGVPPTWVSLPGRSISLVPGEQKEVSFSVHPERSPQSRAGRYPLTVTVSSQKRASDFVEAGLTLTVAAYPSFSSSLSPDVLRYGEIGHVAIQNQGNAPETFTVNWQDLSNELVFTPPQPRFNVPEGEEIVAEFRVDGRQRQFFGGEKPHAFSAVVAPTSGQPQKHTAQAVGRGMIPSWIIPVLIIGCLASAAFGLLVLNPFTSPAGRSTQTAEAGLTQVALLVQQTNQAGTATAEALQNANRATTDAATATANWLVGDDDKDGLSNQEEQDRNTLPDKRDTDEDGLDDGEEVNNRGTDPLRPDTDMDGVQDGEEVSRGMNPLNPDTDGDGLPDSQDPTPLHTTTPTLDLAATEHAGTQAAQDSAATQTAASIQATAQAAAQLTSAAVQTANAAQAATRTAQAVKRLAYIYNSDPAAAHDFETFLEAQGYVVDLVSMADLGSTDFGAYKLILIGRETGSTSDWGDGAGSQAAGLQATGKPILGLGEGGYAFFGKLGLAIGWGNGAHGNASDIFVVNPSASYWNDPINVSIPGNREISINEDPGGYVGIHLPAPVPNVEMVGSIPADSNYYPLVRESERYFLWGFDGTPPAMTNKGRRVFINVVEALIP